MRINRYWNLSEDYYPRMNRNFRATKEQIDECTIWHKDREVPLVFHGDHVRGRTLHDYKPFYKAVCWAIENHKTGLSRWGMRFGDFYNLWARRGGVYRWGCRSFTLKDFKEIKGAMEYHWPELKGE